jgi:hypothetical protein
MFLCFIFVSRIRVRRMPSEDAPANITGEHIVKMVEQRISTPVKDVSYKTFRSSTCYISTSTPYTATNQSKDVIYSNKRAPEVA